MPPRAVRPRAIDYMGIIFGEGCQCTTGTLKFRKFNRNYEFSQDHLADLLQFLHGDGLACERSFEGDWVVDAFRFWQSLTGEATDD
ncbi:hypothetical protein KIW84_014033 [Lathyrus oleraceus]|uniref:Uncharacterized protein n=1 Tax=Pisum sativum TaxID=3888 RepID=A0A9D5BLS5_PEA|nr:hypothetical protein KIW84_014033 [Pisum sativum]